MVAGLTANNQLTLPRQAVQAAVPKAVELIHSLVGELLKSNKKIETGAVPA